MSNHSPTANDRDQQLDEPFRDDSEAQDDQADQRGDRERVKGHDIPATTNAEDLDKAKRTTM